MTTDVADASRAGLRDICHSLIMSRQPLDVLMLYITSLELAAARGSAVTFISSTPVAAAVKAPLDATVAVFSNAKTQRPFSRILWLQIVFHHCIKL